MTRATKHRLTALTLLVGELYFFVRYSEQGAQFHFWLHALLGGALGLAVLTVLRLLRPSREVHQWRAHEATLVGHLWSALPDVAFLVAGVLHASWMDVFSLHITAHFLWPGALLAGLVLWALAVGAWVAVRVGRTRTAAGLLVAAVAFLGVAVALREPVPQTLAEVLQQAADGRTERAWSWVCTVST